MLVWEDGYNDPWTKFAEWENERVRLRVSFVITKFTDTHGVTINFIDTDHPEHVSSIFRRAGFQSLEDAVSKCEEIVSKGTPNSMLCEIDRSQFKCLR